MGNTQKQPYDNVDLFIELSKIIYHSGQTIEGKINLSIKSDALPYAKLTLGFYCRENMLEKASEQTNCTYLTKQIFTYKHQQEIWNFQQNKLAKGQYSIPFKIKLPQNLPTNFTIQKIQTANSEQDNGRIQVKYALKAQLCQDKSLKYDNLTKIHYLNIIKPVIQKQLEPQKYQRHQITNCCGCCYGGQTKLTIYTNKSFALSGQIIQINGEINNTQGSQSLESFSCQLISQAIVADQRKFYYNQSIRGALHTQKKLRVLKGNTENFSFSYKIPDYLEYSHSIGNYSAFVYKFKFLYRFGNSKEYKRVDLPIFIQTQTPKLEVNLAEVPSSYQWSPSALEQVNLGMPEVFQINSYNPLQKQRISFQKFKTVIPSHNYFNSMSAEYPTKQKYQQGKAPNNQIVRKSIFKSNTNPYHLPGLQTESKIAKHSQADGENLP